MTSRIEIAHAEGHEQLYMGEGILEDRNVAKIGENPNTLFAYMWLVCGFGGVQRADGRVSAIVLTTCAKCGSANTSEVEAASHTGVVAPDGYRESRSAPLRECGDCGHAEEA